MVNSVDFTTIRQPAKRLGHAVLVAACLLQKKGLELAATLAASAGRLQRLQGRHPHEVCLAAVCQHSSDFYLHKKHVVAKVALHTSSCITSVNRESRQCPQCTV
jgi:hypothetical protein